MNKTLAYLCSDFTPGMPVVVSNGEKEPPKRFNKKHSAWEFYNFAGYVYSVDPEFGSISVSTTPLDKKVRVRIIRSVSTCLVKPVDRQDTSLKDKDSEPHHDAMA